MDSGSAEQLLMGKLVYRPTRYLWRKDNFFSPLRPLDRCLEFLVPSFLTISFLTILCQLSVSVELSFIHLLRLHLPRKACAGSDSGHPMQSDWDLLLRVPFSLSMIHQTTNGDCGTHLCKVSRCWVAVWKEAEWN